MPKISWSIIVTAYNYGDVLPRAVRSACAQPGDDVEVIVVDDGSTDDTSRVLEELQQSENLAFTSHRQDNAGVAQARNQGVALSRGQYVLFLDADDELLTDAVDLFRAAAGQFPEAGVLVADSISVHPDGFERGSRPNRFGHSRYQCFDFYLSKKLRMANGAVAFARRVFDRLQFDPALRQAEDMPFFAHSVALFDCAAVNGATVRIHKHDGSRRRDAQRAMAVGLEIVDAVFDPTVLPRELMSRRRNFEARRCLSLFRTLVRGGEASEARRYFRRAMAMQPTQMLKPSLWLKYLRSYS